MWEWMNITPNEVIIKHLYKALLNWENLLITSHASSLGGEEL